jgi:hypothetical protein
MPVCIRAVVQGVQRDRSLQRERRGLREDRLAGYGDERSGTEYEPDTLDPGIALPFDGYVSVTG